MNMEKGRFVQKLTKLSIAIWILSILTFIFMIFISSGQEVFNDSTALIFVIDILVGTISFGVFVLLITIKIIRDKQRLPVKRSFKSLLIFGLKIVLLLAILPLFLLFKITNLSELIKRLRENKFKLSFTKPKRFRDVISKFVFFVLILFTLLPIWIIGYIFIGTVVGEQLGYINESIPSVGASMYPTFPEGESVTDMLPYPNGLSLFNRRFFRAHEIGRGDIVVVEDDKTRKTTQELHGYPSGWFKRVIAISGDILEIRDGIVYLNNQPLNEPYTAKAHSTFGQTFLKECSKVTIPENSIFVMGDNRKGSGDSREVGFFSINDIKYVLPLKSQKGDLIKYWRDTSKDFDESSKIRLDKEKYVELLNEKRKEANVKPLKYQPKLELSASKRGEVILKYDDLSYEATRSGYTQLKAMNEAGYSNIVWNEGIIQGHYQAEELIDYLYEFPDWKKNLLHDKDLQEIGVSEVEGNLNGCPSQVIVMHFAGYVPPNYKKVDIESWKVSLSRLKEIQPSWARLKDNANFYQKNKTDIDRMNEIIAVRIANTSAIVVRMEANQWITANEQKMIDQDTALYNEQEVLATRLNNQ